MKSEPAEVLSAVPAKKSVWPLNLSSALLLLFVTTLSSPDSFTRAVTAICLSIALGTSYFSLRHRFNVVALLLLLATASIYIQLLLAISSGSDG